MSAGAKGNELDVVRVEAIPVAHELPPGHRYGSSRGRVSARVATIVRLETRGGAVGWGEGFGPPAAVCALVTELADLVIGQPVNRIVPFARGALQTGYHRSHGGLHVSAISAVEIALWDAWGRHLETSVATLLGGRARDEVVAYASTGYVTDHEDDEGAYADTLHQAVADGFPAAKVKLGLGRERDRRRAEIARDKLGAGRHLMVDFNGNYTADAAIKVLDALRELDIDWVEEPVPAEDLAGLSRVRRAGIPTATGEAVYTRFGFRPLVADQLADVLQPDVAKCGGLAEMRAVVELAHTWNLRVSPHVWGSAISQAATLQLLAATPDSPHTDVVPQPLWFEFDQALNRLRDDILVEPITAHQGIIAVPDGPGLGVAVNEDAIAELRMQVPG